MSLSPSRFEDTCLCASRDWFSSLLEDEGDPEPKFILSKDYLDNPIAQSRKILPMFRLDLNEDLKGRSFTQLAFL